MRGILTKTWLFSEIDNLVKSFPPACDASAMCLCLCLCLCLWNLFRLLAMPLLCLRKKSSGFFTQTPPNAILFQQTQIRRILWWDKVGNSFHKINFTRRLIQTKPKHGFSRIKLLNDQVLSWHGIADGEQRMQTYSWICSCKRYSSFYKISPWSGGYFSWCGSVRRKMDCPSSERSPLVQMILKYVQAVTLVWMEVKVDSWG